MKEEICKFTLSGEKNNVRSGRIDIIPPEPDEKQLQMARKTGIIHQYETLDLLPISQKSNTERKIDMAEEILEESSNFILNYIKEDISTGGQFEGQTRPYLPLSFS